jgi:hypothetical protein
MEGGRLRMKTTKTVSVVTTIEDEYKFSLCNLAVGFKQLFFIDTTGYIADKEYFNSMYEQLNETNKDVLISTICTIFDNFYHKVDIDNYTAQTDYIVGQAIKIVCISPDMVSMPVIHITIKTYTTEEK